jgi:DNA-binding transcriptional MocR family regulator
MDSRTKKQLARAERIYGERRTALVEALTAHGIGSWGRSGLNVWIPVDEEATVVAVMLAAGYAVAGGERFRLASGPGVRVTTATLQPAEAPEVAAVVARAVTGRRRTYSA